jgi:hypothetical protein
MFGECSLRVYEDPNLIVRAKAHAQVARNNQTKKQENIESRNKTSNHNISNLICRVPLQVMSPTTRSFRIFKKEAHVKLRVYTYNSENHQRYFRQEYHSTSEFKLYSYN